MENFKQNALTKGQLTPAQIELLGFVSHLEAEGIYSHLHITLSMSIADFLERPDPEEHPTKKVLEAWYFTLELLRHIHLVASESPNLKK